METTPPPHSFGSGGPLSIAGAAPKTSALAVASLILGLLGMLVLPAIGGLVCGLVAHSRIRQSNGRLKGAGVALAGIIVSGGMLVIFPVVAILAGMLLPALSKAKTKAQVIMGMSNVKQLCLGAVIHAGDNDDKFPAAANWCDAIKPLVGGSSTVFQRPQDPSARSGYGYNARIAGMKSIDVSKDTVLVFELQTGGWNVSGGPELLRQPTRCNEPVVIGFADGHAEAVTSDRFSQLRWKP